MAWTSAQHFPFLIPRGNWGIRRPDQRPPRPVTGGSTANIATTIGRKDVGPRGKMSKGLWGPVPVGHQLWVVSSGEAKTIPHRLRRRCGDSRLGDRGAVPPGRTPFRSATEKAPERSGADTSLIKENTLIGTPQLTRYAQVQETYVNTLTIG
jgi:hypothetical protein